MLEGGCVCGNVRYRLTAVPLFTNACHCTWCQRETGGPHALNTIIETACIEILRAAPIELPVPTASGAGQVILRCPDCQTAVWSHYAGADRKLAYIRVGTLDEPGRCPPDVHIYTSTKLPWFVVPDGVPALPENYRRSDYWPEDSLRRRAAALL